MRSFILSALLFSFLSSCEQRQGFVFKAPPAEKTPSKNEAVATFGEGCFWHTEIVFQSLKGVRDAVSGYAGGTSSSPTYESVSTGETGHAESVNVYYDPSQISYETLVAAFFASHDPTQVNRQGPDEGTQYRSVAFYRNAAEKAVLEKEIAKINASGKYNRKVATQVLPFTKFYTAEAYHQEYIAHNPNNIYVANVNIPDYISFRKTFPGPYKDSLIKR